MTKFILKNGSGSFSCKGCGRQNSKLNTYDWLSDVPFNENEQDMVEVQFKNTRKGYYKNRNTSSKTIKYQRKNIPFVLYKISKK